jgi:hypothetical protein
VSYASVLRATNPTAWWRHGEASGSTMVDSSGNGHNGTYLNSPGLGSPSLIPGDPSNKCVDFNGTNQLGSVPNGSWMDSSRGALSLRAVVNLDYVHAPPDDRDQYIFQRGNFGGEFALALRGLSDGGDGLPRFRFFLGTIDGSYGLVNAGSSFTPSMGVTYDVIGTWDGTNVKLYVDGVLQETVARGGLYVDTSSKIGIGGEATNFTSYTDGRVDETAIWVGHALTATEVADIHAASITPPPILGTMNAVLPRLR